MIFSDTFLIEIYLICYVFLLYGTPAPSTECQNPEAWSASIYGHLKEFYCSKASLANVMVVRPRNALYHGDKGCSHRHFQWSRIRE